jgi:uncharacterized membrane protein
MRNICFICSVALIILGGVGYFAWESIGATKQSVTAAIPAFVGIPMLIGGLVAMKNNMAGMHIAVLFSLLGALAGLGRLIPSVIKGQLDGPASKLVAAMTVICLLFTIMAVRSFIAARKAREAS